MGIILHRMTQFITKTVKYCLRLLKGIYSDTPCELGDEEKFEEYQTDLKDMDTTSFKKKWRGIARRSWNGVADPKDTVYARDMVMSLYLCYLDRGAQSLVRARVEK
jgi:hypothetical protein